MQTVSETWKSVQNQTLLPESNIEIKVDITDPEAQADAVCFSNGEEFYSYSANITNGADKTSQKYATAEPGLWPLDGSVNVASATDREQNGFVSASLSDADGHFSIHPIITIEFSKVYSGIIPGLTIKWSNLYAEYATSFIVKAYHGTWEIERLEVENNASVLSNVSVDLQSYDKITIEILSWSKPYRRARIENVLIGLVRVYSKDDIIQFTQTMSVDPLSAELPKSEISVSIKNVDGEYNPFNPQGIARYLMQRQQVSVRYGYYLNEEIEWISGGVYFMSEWDTPQNGLQFNFKARDVLEFMTEVYTGRVTGNTFSQIAAAALTQAKLPLLENGNERWMLDASLDELYPPADADLSSASIAEILQYIANAAKCVMYQDRIGLFHIERLNYENTDYSISLNNSYQNPELIISKQLKTININNGATIYPVGVIGEEQIVTNPLISSDNSATVAAWIAGYLSNRRILSGNFRADPRLDPLDLVENENQYAEVMALITEVSYTYNGAFRGTYTSRAVNLGNAVYFWSGMQTTTGVIESGQFNL